MHGFEFHSGQVMRLMPYLCVCVCVCVQEMLRCVWRHLVSVLKGESQTLCYTSSLLHSLGSVTVSAPPVVTLEILHFLLFYNLLKEN